MEKCFVIAEAGVNHNGSEALAMQIVEMAAKAGADAVKFQTFKGQKEPLLRITRSGRLAMGISTPCSRSLS